MGDKKTQAEEIYQIYMQELGAVVPCSEDENRKLLAQVKNGSAEARKRLVEGNLKRALFFVQDYIGKGVPLADLIQEANMELVLLADEAHEGSFEKLLESRIRVRMEQVLRDEQNEGEAAEELLARVNALQEISKEMAGELGREATAAEMARRMNLAEEEVKELMKAAMNALKLSELNQSLQS